jgi:uncharacterized protein
MSDVPSPCVDVCRMDPASGLCEGCLRTIDEIAAWGSLDDDGKRRILIALAQRQPIAASAAHGARSLGHDTAGPGRPR